jgi:hypothetical protein
VPGFAGFTLNNLRIGRSPPAQDDFLGDLRRLGASAAMRSVAVDVPDLAPVLDDLDTKAGARDWPAAAPLPQATIKQVVVPSAT